MKTTEGENFPERKAFKIIRYTSKDPESSQTDKKKKMVALGRKRA